MINSCLFCNIDRDRIISENDLVYAVHDGYPVTDLHTLIVPIRHVVAYFDLITWSWFTLNMAKKILKT